MRTKVTQLHQRIVVRERGLCQRRFGHIEFQAARLEAIQLGDVLDVPYQLTAVFELCERQVDGYDRRRHAGVAPQSHLSTALFEHPVADRRRQSGFFGLWYEGRRPQQTAPRVVPAQQRLHAHDIPRDDLYLRLVEQFKLALLDRGFELFSDGNALPNFLVQILGVKMILIAARVLGPVQREIGLGQHGVGPNAGRAIRTDTYAGCHDCHLRSIEQVGLGEAFLNFGG